jgi:hypothetical protein
VQQSVSGAEVRVQLRSTPAIGTTMQCIFGSAFEAGKLLAAWRSAAQPLRFYAPLWCDAADLTEAVTAGDALLSLDTTDRPFFAAPGYVMLWRSETYAEVVSVNFVDDGLVQLDDPGVVNSYAVAGTRVVPCRIMWLSLPLDLTWQNSTIASTAISFVDEKDQVGYAIADSAVSPVAASVLIYQHSHSVATGDPHVSASVWFAEAVVFDDADLPMPSAEVVWSVPVGTVDVRPSINSRFARVHASTPSSEIAATCGSAVGTIGAS